MIILVVECNKDSKNQHDNSQYHDEIKKILKIQEKIHQKMVHKSDKVRPKFEKGKVNRYFFKDGQMIISYKLFKNKEQLFYAAAAYEIKGEKVYYIQDINPKDYIKEHQSDYKDIRTK
nr:cystatin-like fold lipoprotein [Staphylococcus saccharolyticus]